MPFVVKKLLDATNPEVVKAWADNIYEALTDSGTSVSGGTGTVQRGVITIGAGQLTATATVDAVDMDTAELRHLGQTCNPLAIELIYLTLTDSTTITATRGSSSSGAQSVSWELTG